MYILVCIGPNIVFVKDFLGWHLFNIRKEHLFVVKIVLRYLKWIEDCTLTYQKVNNLELGGYRDLNFISYIDNQKSTSGYISTLASDMLS